MLHRIAQAQQHLTRTMAVVSAPKTPDINLYTSQTPNGIKISIALEELGSVSPPRTLQLLTNQA